jgi:hypothetical protein
MNDPTPTDKTRGHHHRYRETLSAVTHGAADGAANHPGQRPGAERAGPARTRRPTPPTAPASDTKPEAGSDTKPAASPNNRKGKQR